MSSMSLNNEGNNINVDVAGVSNRLDARYLLDIYPPYFCHIHQREVEQKRGRELVLLPISLV